MKKIFVVQKGRYFSAPIDITVEEWKQCLLNENIFDPASKKMVLDWYKQPDHQATNKEVMFFNNLSGKTPYNGIVVGLGKRIINFLKRFEVIDSRGEGKSYWIIPFEGWWQKSVSSSFVWKLREPLIIALEELGLVDPVEISGLKENEEISSSKEGRKISYQITKYERNPKNRAAAIRIHGCVCCVCDFDFEKVYGPLGSGFIEVHHIRPLSEKQQETEINPQKDLVCVCPNCHRMLHRREHRGQDILTPEELKEIIKTRK